MKNHVVAGLMLCCAALSAEAQGLSPVYTSIQNCPSLQSLTLADRTVSRAQGFGIMRCKGTGGLDLAVVDEDPRSWLAVIAGRYVYGLHAPMVQGFKLGHFPDISTTKVVEWRVNGEGSPEAFIVRVHYQDPNVPATQSNAQRSVLMVFSLRTLPPRLVGMTSDNGAARRMADGN